MLLLADDRRLQPHENVVPLVRTDALDRWGDRLRTAFDDVSARLTTGGVGRLNREIELLGRTPQEAALEWWEEQWSARSAGVPGRNLRHCPGGTCWTLDADPGHRARPTRRARRPQPAAAGGQPVRGSAGRSGTRGQGMASLTAGSNNRRSAST